MKLSISKIKKTQNTNSLISERILKYKWVYYLFNGLVSFSVISMCLIFFILSSVAAGNDFYKNMTILFSLTVFLNLSILNGRHQSSSNISIYELRFFPLKPIELFFLFIKIFITDIRYLNYFFVLLLLVTGMILGNYEFHLIAFFCITLILYFVCAEIIFSLFFLIRKTLPHNVNKKISTVIPLFSFIFFILISKKNYHPIPILTFPIDFLISLLNNNITQSLAYFGSIIILTTVMVFISYLFVKSVIA